MWGKGSRERADDRPGQQDRPVFFSFCHRSYPELVSFGSIRCGSSVGGAGRGGGRVAYVSEEVFARLKLFTQACSDPAQPCEIPRAGPILLARKKPAAAQVPVLAWLGLGRLEPLIVLPYSCLVSIFRFLHMLGR